MEQVRVLAALDEQAYAAWSSASRSTQRERLLDDKRRAARSKGKSTDNVKLSKGDEAMIDSMLPQTVFDALQVETDQLRANGWNLPPGSRWISYARPADAFEPKPRPRRVRRRESLPTVGRFAVGGAVRPRLTEALWIGERVRGVLMGCSRVVGGEAAVVFSGKTPDGSPLEGCHGHAHILCEAPRNDGQITHLTVYAPMGFTEQDERALSRFATDRGVRRWFRQSGHELQFVLLGVGQPEDFGGTNEKAGRSPVLAESRVWVSRTPLVPTDHLRVRDHEKKDPERRAAAEQRELMRIVRKELERRPWLRSQAETAEIELVPATDLGGHRTTWLKFRRERKSGNGVQRDSRGHGFRLVFREAVRGPIALGYGCHFGLGVFVAEEGS